MKNGLFCGVCASTVTPLGPNGELRLELLKPHVDWMIADGADAISPLGSSGEFVALEVEDLAYKSLSLMTTIQCKSASDAAHFETRQRHHYSTRHTIELSKHAEKAGASALLIVPPYYMAPTPKQVMVHYRRIAESVSIPVVLYHKTFH